MRIIFHARGHLIGVSIPPILSVGHTGDHRCRLIIFLGEILVLRHVFLPILIGCRCHAAIGVNPLLLLPMVRVLRFLFLPAVMAKAAEEASPHRQRTPAEQVHHNVNRCAYNAQDHRQMNPMIADPRKEAVAIRCSEEIP